MREALRRAIEAGVGSTGGARWREAATSSWASAWSVSGVRSRVFVKISRHPGLLECEADGLRALAATRSVRVPAVIAEGSVDDDAWLALEWLAFVGEPPPAALGTAIATLHASAAPAGAGGRFGWHRDNRLGASVQHNGWHDDWSETFTTQSPRKGASCAAVGAAA